MKTAFHRSPYELTRERELLAPPEWETVVDRDANWRDKCGQEHHWVGESIAAAVLNIETYWCDSCEDEHEDREWQCAACGGVLSPPTVQRMSKPIYGPWRTTIARHNPDGSTFKWFNVTFEKRDMPRNEVEWVEFLDELCAAKPPTETEWRSR